jgi:hypothetical protein
MLAQQRTIIQLVELVDCMLCVGLPRVLTDLLFKLALVGDAGAAAHHHSACGASQRAA